jgi:thiamine-phosphate diphosphorylase
LTTSDGPLTRRPVPFVPAAFYPIIDTDDRVGLPARIIHGVLEAGVPWLQLRCKGTPTSSFLAFASALVRDAAASGAHVIVNDRVDVALASGAAGVHLGQEDLPLAVARHLAGDHLVIGVSTHDVAEARAAAGGGADYIGFGPMFATASKADAQQPRTLDALRRVRDAVGIPIVAIGGLTPQTAIEVLAAGADAVAMIGALANAPDVVAFTTRLLALEARSR